MKNFLIRIIRWYQGRGGSKVHFNLECNFEPTCSEYAIVAIQTHGISEGLKLALKRIQRCNDPDALVKITDPVPK